jgi:glycosyltransferase involved in cell wall biosynthesis
MRLGIAISTLDPWIFFQDVYEDLGAHYEVDVFKFYRRFYPLLDERINYSLLQKDLRVFLKSHDAVFFEWASGLLEIATQQPKECKIVTRLHRYELFEWSHRINWDRVDKIILVSHAMMRRFSEKFPEHSHKAEVIPVGVSTDKFRPSPRRFNGDIGILCNLTPRKRVYDLILAFYELSQARSDLHLHIAGGYEDLYKDYFEAMHHLVRRLDLQDRVTFYGNVTETWKWYPKIDIYISNSYSEGMQVAPMEAMSSGCYCLSHQWDGAEELLPAQNLFLTNTELVEKVLRYYDLPETAKLQEKSRLRGIACEQFDIELTKAKIRTIISELS